MCSLVQIEQNDKNMVIIEFFDYLVRLLTTALPSPNFFITWIVRIYVILDRPTKPSSQGRSQMLIILKAAQIKTLLLLAGSVLIT